MSGKLTPVLVRQPLEIALLQDDDDAALQVDILAAALRSDQAQSADLVEFLAKQFEAMLPEHTTVVRGGWFLSNEKPVKELTVRFDEFHYQLLQEKKGIVTPRELKVVRGVALRTNDIGMDQWIQRVADSLSKLAAGNSKARQALNDFLVGR